MDTRDLDALDYHLKPLAYQDQFQKAPLPFRLLPPLRIQVHRALVLIITFLCYATFHASRKPPAIVKTVLRGSNNATALDSPVNRQNSTGGSRNDYLEFLAGAGVFPWPESASHMETGWAPFNGPNGKSYLGDLDVAFLGSYAIGMFLAGHLGDRLNLRYFLTAGMLASAILTCAFGAGQLLGIHKMWYFTAVQACAGFFQACGWPSVVSIMANWYGKGKRGLVMGAWNSHTSVGNMLGSVVASYFLRLGWGWAFIAPGLIMAAMAVMVFFWLVVEPADVGYASPYDSSTSGDSSPCSSISSLSTEALRYLERHPHVMRKPGHQQQLLQSVQSNATPPMRRPSSVSSLSSLPEDAALPVSQPASPCEGALGCPGSFCSPSLQQSSLHHSLPQDLSCQPRSMIGHPSKAEPWGSSSPQRNWAPAAGSCSGLGSSRSPSSEAAAALLRDSKARRVVAAARGGVGPWVPAAGEGRAPGKQRLPQQSEDEQPGPRAEDQCVGEETQPHRQGHLQGRGQVRLELLERQQHLQHPVPRLIGLSSQLCLLDVPPSLKISGSNVQAKGIGFLAAWKIPGVAGFALTLFFAKLVAYTFLYWLPFYLSMGMGGGSKLSPQAAGNLSVLFDVGGVLGGVAAGLLSDRTGASACVSCGFVLMAIPAMLLYRTFGATCMAVNIALMMGAGFFVNGPYSLITTAVSADLGTQSGISGNAKALATVTAIIDGMGSCGAAVGPLLTGHLVSMSGQFDNVFLMLYIAACTAGLLLLGLVVPELKALAVAPPRLPSHRCTADAEILERLLHDDSHFFHTKRHSPLQNVTV